MPAVISLPPNAALLLDLDGTLIDIAPTPDSVIVPPDLPSILLSLRAQLSDALAIVTGRPIAQVDALLPGIPYAIAGEHGGALRPAPGVPEERIPVPPIPHTWLDTAETLVAAHPGAILERKAHSFVMHYRLAPDAGPIFHTALTQLLGHSGSHVIGTALMAWEVKPGGIDKGQAVTSLMRRPPFAGRTPVFIGDDVTDEDGIRAAQALGGLGLKVQDHFTTAAGVRAWLAHVVKRSF